ncbi:AraC family transcriptional regulator [Ectopseudomonas mendocina]|uniref:AraC family transcriptional regulator n=1 Tax=Ectopseudomonas mendocina TaxID=300 RepID=UPI001ADFDF9E|nr:AraC family transcriptional regulator [Pseudomonas mendocina]QTN48145.1 AraC family transcriptional regulator [Pseudomonas mendocina]
MHTITNACFQIMAKAFSSDGCRFGRHLSGLDQMLAEGGPVRVIQVYRLLETLVSESGDVDIGLRAYQHFHPSVLGVKSYVLMSSPTLAQALQRLVDYHPMTSDGSHMFLERYADRLELVGVENSTVVQRAPRAFIDAGAALVLAIVHWLAPFQKPMPQRLELTYPEPQDTRQLHRLFGENLCFSARRNCMTFGLEAGAIELPTAAAALHTLHVEYAQAQMSEQVDGSLEARVRRILAEQLSQGVSPGLSDVADLLGMSRRSLQHGLVRDEANFTLLLDQARQRQAASFLRNTTRSLKYISAQLGFRDQSSFHKACVRWFGISPNQYRLMHGDGGATS